MKKILPALALAMAFTAPALAAEPIYAPKGTVNADTYTFYAASTGDLTAWFVGGRTVTYNSRLSISINGGAWSAPQFLQSTTPVPSFFNFGPVTKDDVISFRLSLRDPTNVRGTEIYSDASLNPGGVNQVFSAEWGGGAFSYNPWRNQPTMEGEIPAGNYQFVAFEDILGLEDPNFANDYDYNDHRFAFTNLRTVVPEPATWAMLITGFGLVGFAMRRRKATVASVSA